ncbi:hypothetical protein NHX12_005605 [Muraenolepis orangiensis]|uniref:Uncharacterized protein n=1 Tax=Muraenolepis orangiensis TaxID=630683 RepID=A0A9Q0DU86_9TELE|nr:hypothetical protein NHX12_005605 [Muraenolepis orangiensis]
MVAAGLSAGGERGCRWAVREGTRVGRVNKTQPSFDVYHGGEMLCSSWESGWLAGCQPEHGHRIPEGPAEGPAEGPGSSPRRKRAIQESHPREPSKTSSTLCSRCSRVPYLHAGALCHCDVTLCRHSEPPLRDSTGGVTSRSAVTPSSGHRDKAGG